MKLSRIFLPAVLGLLCLSFTARYARADLLVASYGTSSVRRYSDAGADLGVFIASGSGGLGGPIGLSIRASDNSILVSSFGTGSVKRYSGVDGSYLGDFATVSGSNPRDNVFGPDGNLYVSNGTNDVTRYDGTTGANLGVFVASGSGGLANAQGLTFMPGGDLLVSSSNTATVKRYNGSTGAYIGDFANITTTNIASVYGPDGNFYVSSFSGNVVKKYDGTTGAFISDFATTNLNRPAEIIFGADNNLYVSSYNDNAVRRYNGTTGAFIDTFATGIDRPRDMRFFTATPTPEPETWAMMFMGVGALGLMGWKRRKSEAGV